MSIRITYIVVKSNSPPHKDSAATIQWNPIPQKETLNQFNHIHKKGSLRQVNPIHKKGPYFLKYTCSILLTQWTF